MGSSSHPRITGQLLAAAGMVGALPYRQLIVGQIEVTGNAVDGQYYPDVQDLTDDEVIALFGEGELTGRILKARDVANANFEIAVIGLDAAAGTEATRTLLFDGTSTEEKLITVNAISKSKFSFNVTIPTGTAAADAAALVQAGFDELADTFPADVATATVTTTLTAKDTGTIPNKFTVEIDNLPAGLTVNGSIGTDRSQFSGGATDPTVTGIFDNVASIRFHSISWPWENDYDEVDDFLTPRNTLNNNFLHGVAFIGYDDTEANIKAKVNGTTPLNSQNLVFAGNRQISGVSAIIEPADWRVAEFLAIEGLRLTDDAPIASYVTVDAPLDTVGGLGTSSLGYYNTPLANTDTCDPDLLFDGTEQVNLKEDGYTIIGVNDSSTSIIMGEVVTTYKFNTKGIEDVSFKFLNYIRTGYGVLEIFYRTLKSDYSQFRLTGGDVVGGRAMANKESIEAEYTRIYKRLSSSEFALTQAGSDAEQAFYSALSIDIDLSQGQVNSDGDLPIVTQIREINMTWQLAFNVGG